jgi:hypothetical protein
MARSTWTIWGPAGQIADSTIINASFRVGRESYLDDFATNYATVTVRNNTGLYNNISPGAEFYFQNSYSNQRFYFWVQSIQTDDTIDQDAATATLTLFDSMGRLTKAQGSNFEIAFSNPATVILLYYLFDDAVTKGYLVGAPTFDNTVVGLATYLTGKQQYFLPDQIRQLSDQLNIVLTTEGTGYYMTNKVLTPVSRATMAAYSFGYTFAGSTSTTKIIWDTLSRSNLGDLFANQAFVSYVRTDLPYSSTKRNSTSVTANGVYQASLETNTTDIDAYANYYANALSDTSIQSYRIRLSDFAQNVTALRNFENSLKFLHLTLNSLQYVKPGTGTTTDTVRVEGYTVVIEPGVTYYELDMSPGSIYSYFVLNNSTNGVLDTSRLDF